MRMSAKDDRLRETWDRLVLLRISYRPLPDVTPESELEVLAAVYSFLIRSHENRRVVAADGDDQQKGGEEENCASGPLGVARPWLPVHEDGSNWLGRSEAPQGRSIT